MQFVIEKGRTPSRGVFGVRKRGRPKGTKNRQHKYRIVITLPNGKKKYVYDLKGKHPDVVAMEITSKFDRISNIEYHDELIAQGYGRPKLEEFPAYRQQMKESRDKIGKPEPLPQTNKEKTKRQKKLFVQKEITDNKTGEEKTIYVRRKTKPHDNPAGDYDNIHVVNPQKNFDTTGLTSVEVDPLTYFAENILNQVNKPKFIGSKKLLIHVPNLDLSQYPVGTRNYILSKFDGEEEMRQQLHDKPISFLITLGLTRINPKTGLPLLNKKEMDALNAEWYWNFRNRIRGELGAFRLTDEYTTRAERDEKRGHTLESKFTSKRKMKTALKHGVELTTGDQEKTETRALIDSVSAQYMDVAFRRLRELALNFDPKKPKNRFDKIAYRDVQLNVRHQVNADLRNRFGMTYLPVDVQPAISDIDDPEHGPKLSTNVQKPEDRLAYEEVAESGKRAFFSHFRNLPEAYQRILSMHLNIDFADDEMKNVGNAHTKNERAFADIARTETLWKVPNGQGEFEDVDLTSMAPKSREVFLARLEAKARRALEQQFRRKRRDEEESNESSARIPLSKQGRLAYQWLKLQARLAESSGPATTETRVGKENVYSQAKFEDKKQKRNYSHTKLTEHPRAPGVKFFVAKQKEQNKIEARDLEIAIAMGTKPGPAQATKVQPLTPKQLHRYARMDKLLADLRVPKQLRELEGKQTQTNVTPPVKELAAMQYLNRLYKEYKAASTKHTDVLVGKLKNIKRAQKDAKAQLAGIVRDKVGDWPEEYFAQKQRVYVNRTLRLIINYIIAERNAVQKSLTVADFSDMMDEWDFQQGRMYAFN